LATSKAPCCCVSLVIFHDLQLGKASVSEVDERRYAQIFGPYCQELSPSMTTAVAEHQRLERITSWDAVSEILQIYACSIPSLFPKAFFMLVFLFSLQVVETTRGRERLLRDSASLASLCENLPVCLRVEG